MSFSDIGRWLIVLGVVMLLAGGVLLLLGRLPWAGRLPGDITWQRGNLTVFAPIGTMLLISLLLTIILNIILRLRK